MKPMGRLGVTFILAAFATLVSALNWISIDDATVSLVMVNGGSDSLNSGTTCIQTTPAADACTGGYIYIPNNNKQLLAAALTANASRAKVYLQYASDGPSGHCPGQVFTTCSLNSLGVK